MQNHDLSEEQGLARWLPELKLAARHIPWLGDPWAIYLEDVVKRREKRAQQIAASFEQCADAPFDALLLVAESREVVGDLLAQAVEAGVRTNSEAKLRSLGRALALGYIAEDDAALDETQLMMTALIRLEAPHIKVLDYLVRNGSRYEPVADVELAGLFPNGVAVVYALLKELESLGMAGPTVGPTSNPDASVGWVPWDFGLLLHRRLLTEAKGDG